jgi:hypothetical protein
VEKKEPCTEDRLFARAIQRIDRHEIIPVGRQKIVTPAIHPATGQPFIIWVVNNTSHSLGTFEDPFPTLLDAQNASSANQGIYVFPGDGTTNGMSDGIVLKDGQLFLGASFAYTIPTTIGPIFLPAMASTMPNITNTAGDVVTLGNNNTVFGFNITTTFDGSNGIVGNGISNLIADSNTFTSPTNITTNGITLNNCFGQILVGNSVFNGFANNDGSNNGNGIYVASGALETLNITGSSFNNISGVGAFAGDGIFLNGGTITTFSSSGNTFNNFSSNGGIVSLGTITTFSISGNTFNNLNGSSGIFTGDTSTITTLSSSGNIFSDLINFSNGFSLNNTITTFSSTGDTFTGLNNSNGMFFTLPSGNTNVSISNDTFDTDLVNPADGFAVNIEVFGGTLCLEFVNNIATFPSGGIPAYEFDNFGGISATFTSTSNSTTSANTGTFNFIGVVSFPGNCTISP